jgi:hypothetical protein
MPAASAEDANPVVTDVLPTPPLRLLMLTTCTEKPIPNAGCRVGVESAPVCGARGDLRRPNSSYVDLPPFPALSVAGEGLDSWAAATLAVARPIGLEMTDNSVTADTKICF